jgi:MoxR-like ATPase
MSTTINAAGTWVPRLREQVARVVVGQQYLVDRLLIGLLANGHVLLEGVPGLAKTLSVRTLAQTVHADFSRIQFTPDLLPADIVGTLIYDPKTGEYAVKRGPIFANFVLADEINRAPAKVQSALLEAMQERQVTLGGETHKLPAPFLVLATQNPIDQEGTYPLPEAQVDRFMLKLNIGYPTREEERKILDAMATTSPKLDVEAVISRRARPSTRSTWPNRSATTSSRSSSPPAASTRAAPTSRSSSSSAPRRARPSTSPSPPRPGPSCRAATT